MLYTHHLYISGLIHLYSLHQMTFLDSDIYMTLTIYHQPSHPFPYLPCRITWIPLPHLHHRPNPTPPTQTMATRNLRGIYKPRELFNLAVIIDDLIISPSSQKP